MSGARNVMFCWLVDFVTTSAGHTAFFLSIGSSSFFVIETRLVLEQFGCLCIFVVWVSLLAFGCWDLDYVLSR